MNDIGRNPVAISASKRAAGSSPGERERLLAMAHGRADLVTLGRGDPDLPTPPHIVQAAGLAALTGPQHCVAEARSTYAATTALERALERITPVIQALRAR